MRSWRLWKIDAAPKCAAKHSEAEIRSGCGHGCPHPDVFGVSLVERHLFVVYSVVHISATDAFLTLRLANGSEQALSRHVQTILMQTLESLANNVQVTSARVPDELTSTAAAEILGVSRPTLMKWVRHGTVNSYRVGSHARFKREDVLALKEHRAQNCKNALHELRLLDNELKETFEN